MISLVPTPSALKKHDLDTPGVLLWGVAILADPLETFAVPDVRSMAIPLRIAADSRTCSPLGIPNRTQLSGENH